jgi:hypothetical protein
MDNCLPRPVSCTGFWHLPMRDPPVYGSSVSFQRQATWPFSSYYGEHSYLKKPWRTIVRRFGADTLNCVPCSVRRSPCTALHCILRYSCRVCYAEEIRSVTLRVVNGPLFLFNRLKTSEGTFLCFPVYERGRKAERNVNSVHAAQFIILYIIKKTSTCTYKPYSMYTYEFSCYIFRQSTAIFRE